ncbi:hypothetical protein FPV67DRAFT_1475909 [Lyophyllum atratum]|nr:hypothetical protein FPV67DRAFT_1475909 [Lyophyllum atratum]
MSTVPDLCLEGQVVLILCGLVASGKSTFAQQLQNHFPQFHRCNQDDLGDRRQVERLARDSLARGLSVCIDRTNFNAAQRSYWIEIAREFPGTSIWVIVFDTPYETKLMIFDLTKGTSHPTIKNAEQGLYVLSRFAADFELPSPHEGYDRIISLEPADHPSPVYSRSEIAAILRRVQASAPVSAVSSTRSHSSQTFQGWQPSRGHSHWGNSSRGYTRSLHRGMPQGRSCTTRGAGYAWGHTSHFRSSSLKLNDPPQLVEGRAQLEGEPAPGSTSHGTGTIDDPLIIS